MKTYTEKEVIGLLVEKHVQDFYPNPCPEGSDHVKNIPYMEKWLKENKKIFGFGNLTII